MQSIRASAVAGCSVLVGQGWPGHGVSMALSPPLCQHSPAPTSVGNGCPWVDREAGPGSGGVQPEEGAPAATGGTGSAQERRTLGSPTRQRGEVVPRLGMHALAMHMYRSQACTRHACAVPPVPCMCGPSCAMHVRSLLCPGARTNWQRRKHCGRQLHDGPPCKARLSRGATPGAIGTGAPGGIRQ